MAVDGGPVIGLDPSAAMLTVARQAAPALTSTVTQRPLSYVRGNGSALPFAAAFDGVFSNATLHWIADHESVFRSVYAALRPGGRFVAQCGGGANLARLYARAASLMRDAAFARFFGGWRNPWHFVLPDATRAALLRAGFDVIDASLEEAPVTFGDSDAYSEFIECVCVRHHLQHLPDELQADFLSRLTDAALCDDPALTLDYCRLNIHARRPAA
jgi:trans-aconitate 2-methyltransferase